MKIMRNIVLVALLIGILSFTSCQFDDYDIEYKYTSVYFANQEYNRNIVVGEGLDLGIGVMFGGLIKNPSERTIGYIIDTDLIPSGKTLMPANYYTLGNSSEIIIPAGKEQGYLSVVMDSSAFLADPRSLTGEFVLPVRLTSTATLDTILALKDYQVTSISYWAKQHGRYYYNGTSTKSENGVQVSTQHYESLTSDNDGVRDLITVGPTRLQMMPAQKGTDPSDGYSLIVDVPTKGGGAVTILSSTESPVVVTPNGTSTYDEPTKTFILNYAYSAGGFDYVVADTLTFRNRIRDVQADGLGVNEWRGF